MESPFLQMMAYGLVFGAVGTVLGIWLASASGWGRGSTVIIYGTMVSGIAIGWIIASLPGYKSNSQTTAQITHNITEHITRDYKMDWTPVASNISHMVEAVLVAVVIGLIMLILMRVYLSERRVEKRIAEMLETYREQGRAITGPKQMEAITGSQSKALVVKQETLPAIKLAE